MATMIRVAAEAVYEGANADQVIVGEVISAQARGDIVVITFAHCGEDRDRWTPDEEMYAVITSDSMFLLK